MLKLEYVKKDSTIKGIEPNEVVRVLTTEPIGNNTLTVYYKVDGQIHRYFTKCSVVNNAFFNLNLFQYIHGSSLI